MKVKAYILSAILSAALLSVNVSAETTKPAETTVATTISQSVVTTALSKVSETTTTAVTTTTEIHGGAGSIPIDPEEIGTTEFYDKIVSYVGDKGGENLNNNLTDNAMTIDKSTIDYSEKSLYTITTRSGDVFYLIINSSDGSVMFLNNVDTADLTSMLNKNNGETSNTMNENAVEELEKIEEDKKQPETTENTETPTKPNTAKNNDWLNNILMIVGVCVLAVGVAVAFVIIKRRRNRGNSGYDDSAFDGIDFNTEYEDDDSPMANGNGEKEE